MTTDRRNGQPETREHPYERRADALGPAGVGHTADGYRGSFDIDSVGYTLVVDYRSADDADLYALAPIAGTTSSALLTGTTLAHAVRHATAVVVADVLAETAGGDRTVYCADCEDGDEVVKAEPGWDATY